MFHTKSCERLLHTTKCDHLEMIPLSGGACTFVLTIHATPHPGTIPLAPFLHIPANRGSPLTNDPQLHNVLYRVRVRNDTL